MQDISKWEMDPDIKLDHKQLLNDKSLAFKNILQSVELFIKFIGNSEIQEIPS